MKVHTSVNIHAHTYPQSQTHMYCPRHQSIVACFRTRKSARILEKMCKAADAHTSALQRVRRKFSAPGCTNMPVMSIVHAFILTACLEAYFWTRKRSPQPRKIG